jgi:hypothetical protein
VREHADGGLERRNTVVVHVARQGAAEHPSHADGTVAALEEVYAHGHVPSRGQAPADVPDVVVEPRRLMDDHHAG